VREPVCKVGRVRVSLVKLVAEGVEERYVGRFERAGGLLLRRRQLQQYSVGDEDGSYWWWWLLTL
jgi:hypothetical protein